MPAAVGDRVLRGEDFARVARVAAVKLPAQAKHGLWIRVDVPVPELEGRVGAEVAVGDEREVGVRRLERAVEEVEVGRVEGLGEESVERKKGEGEVAGTLAATL